MQKISQAEAMRLSAIYTPKSLPFRLKAFIPSSSLEERQRRVDAWQAEVNRLNLRGQNDDREQ